MIKICTLPDRFIELGNNAVVSVKLKYGGTDTELYAAEAGGKVSFSSRGQYLYINNNLSLKGTYSTAGVSISTQFTPDIWEFTLIADTNATADKKTKTIEFNIIKELNIGIAEYDNINPILSNNRDIQYIDKLIFQSLMDITYDFKIENLLAKNIFGV